LFIEARQLTVILTDIDSKARFKGLFLKKNYKFINKLLVTTLLFVFLYSCPSFSQLAINNQSESTAKVLAASDFTKPLTIAINETSFPYHAVDKESNAVGIMPDLWRLWAEKQQVEIEFIVLPWVDTLTQVAKGNVDIHAGLSLIDSRRQYLHFSTPLFPILTHLYVHQQLNDVENISDLKPYIIGVVKGSAHPEILEKQYPELTQRFYENRHELYRAALNHEILVFTGLEKLSEKHPDYQELMQRFPAYKYLRYQQGDYGVAVTLENTNLMAFIEQGFTKISEEEKSTIERKWLGISKKKNSLLIAFDPSYPPYMAVTQSGKPQGLLIDFWRLWSKQTGIAVEFIARDMEENIELLKQQKIDVLLAYPNNLNDVTEIQFAEPIYHATAQLYVAKPLLNSVKNSSTTAIDSLKEFVEKFPSKEVGIWQESAVINEVETLYPNLKLRYFDTFNSMFEAAEYNEISAMIGLTDLMNARLVQNHLQALFSPLTESIYQVALSPLVHRSNKKLVKMVNDGFTAIDIQNLMSIEERWLNEGEHYYHKLVKKVTLTKQENDFVNQDKAIRVGMLTDLSPMEFVNKEGKFAGINRDVLDIISQRTDLQFEYVGFDSWQKLYQAMISENIDMLTGITPTKERKEQLLFSDSYWQMPWVIIHPQYLGKKSQLNDFHGKQVAIVKGYYLIEKLRKQHPLVTFKLVDDRQQALVALQQERVDGFITTIASATQLLKQDHIITMVISIMESVSLDQNHFGINKKAPLLKNIIDKGLATLSDREKQSIYDSWFSLAINTGLDKNVVLQVGAQIGAIILLILIVIVMWNRRLQVEIKHREQLEKIMKHMATHDELTGLANRVLLKDRLNTAIAFHQRQSLQMAVLFMDLDGFKAINDTYGHDVGDELLQEVALRLQGCVRGSDTVVRFGGDEFVLLLTGLHSQNEASYVAEKVLKLMQSEFELSKTNAYIGCSIGISMYPGDGTNDIDLLKIADTLMYKVKAAGKNHYIFS